jgi:nitroreductase
MDNSDINIPAPNDLIMKRWSPVAFSDKPVEEEKLMTLFEASRWAPSSMNEQPWRFIYATNDNPEEYQRILDTIVEGNQVWAKNAPVLMVIVAKSNFDHKNLPNAHAWFDTGLAIGNMLVQATALGLYQHQMAGFSPEIAKELLNIPNGFEPIVAAALGYLGDPQKLSESLQGRDNAPRKRKPLNEIVFKGIWGN